MLGKKSSVAPILAFLKENDVSTAIIHICTKTRSWWCMYHRLKIFFFVGGGGGGGGEGGGGGGGLERESGQQAAAVPFPPSGEFKKV